jgi:hypothetical protein
MPRIRRNVRVVPVSLLALAAAGLLVHAAPPQEVGTWAALGAVADARSGAASVALTDGRTLIAGGVANGSPTDSVVVYDPLANTFTSIGQLLAARVGHTATLLADGRILVVGGTTGDLVSADIEVFDPSSGGSTLVASLTQARTRHGAARLGNGTVLIVGGTTLHDVVLASAEVFDPATSTATLAAGSLQQPRTGASATTLIDGRVLVVGGSSDGTQDLSSAEVFEAVSQTFTPATTTLSVARSGHTAVLLPHNNSVLISGGSSGGAPQSASDLFLPALFPDPYSYGMGTFAATASMAAARTGAVGGSTTEEGRAFAAGGGSADAEVYRFTTIKTDKDDYAPGERAVITGTGWQPGEAVKLVFQEDPAVHEDYVIDRDENSNPRIVADENGNIFWDQWSPEEHDLGVRFYLMAMGQQSSRRAQVTFTDTRTVINQVNIDVPQSPASVPPGNTATYVIGVEFNTPGGAGNPGNNSCTVQMSTEKGSGQTGLPDTDSVSFSPSLITSTNGSDHQTTLTIDTASGISAGSYTFTIVATGTGGSGNDCSTGDNKKQNATLVVGAAQASFTIDDVTLNEGNSGTTAFSFTVTKAGSGSASVNFATSPGTTNPATEGTCAAGIDYQPATGTLNFASADTTKTITVSVCGDLVNEANETFKVTLSDPVTATITDVEGIGTITNDDAVPSFSINDVTLAEGNSGTTVFQFTVTKTGATVFATSVNFATAAGTTNPATVGICGAGIDYELASGTLSFAAADTTKTFNVNVCGDGVHELNETFKVMLSAASGATISDPEGLGTITNDDAEPTLSIDDVALAEGDSSTKNFVFTVTKTGATALVTFVNFATAVGTTNPATAGTCGAGIDYESASGTLSFGAADMTKTFNVSVCGDGVYELNETFKVTLSAASGATISDPEGFGTITNDDAAPTLSIGDVTQNEGNSGTTNFAFTVTKSGATEVDASVSFATGAGATYPATAGASTCVASDYKTASGTLTIAAADASNTITVLVCGETVYERNQTFTVTLSNPSHGSITDGEGVGTITNDDTAPTLSIGDVTKNEGNSGTTPFAFTVTKTGDTEVDATVAYATGAVGTSPATAGAGTCTAADYQTTSGTLNIPAANANGTVTVLVCGDNLFELDQTFKVTLTSPIDASITDGEAVGTITNDDAKPTISIGDVSLAEGNADTTNFVFTVTRTGGSEVETTASYITGVGPTNPATAGSGTCTNADYQTASGLVTVAAADSPSTTGTITVLVCGEAIYELNQTFKVTLSSPVYADIVDGEGVGTITNDDAKPTLSINDVSQNEGDSGTANLVFTVTKSGLTEVTAGVSFATAVGGANPAAASASCGVGVDYRSQSGSVSFLAADTIKTITVLICGDDVDENDETLLVNLSYPTEATLADGQGLGTIVDDDATAVITPSSTSQTGQYSDDITDVTISALDADTAGTSLYASTQYNKNGGAFAAGLPSHLALTLTSTAGNSRTWTLENDLLVEAGVYVVRVTVSDGTNAASTDITITVDKEDAGVAPGAGNLDAYSAPGGTPLASLVLTFTVREKNPEPDTNGGAHPGDIDNTGLSVSLNGAGGNNKSATCTPSATIATPPAYSDVKTYTCAFTSVAVDAYEIQAAVTGNYYVGSLLDTVAVYDPTAGFVTGGGKLWFSSTDLNPERVSFGLVFNFTGKNKTNPRGNLVVLRHLANGDICRAKSNAIDAPAVINNTASFSGKGNYSCTKPDGTTYDGIGNQTLLGWVEDNGQGSTATGPDRFWINVNAPNSVLAMGGNGPANAQELTGGNIQVPQPSSQR